MAFPRGKGRSPAAGCSPQVILADIARAMCARVLLFGSISSLDLLPATSHVGVVAMNPVRFAKPEDRSYSVCWLSRLPAGGVLGLSKVWAGCPPQALQAQIQMLILSTLARTPKHLKGYVVGHLESYFNKKRGASRRAPKGRRDQPRG